MQDREKRSHVLLRIRTLLAAALIGAAAALVATVAAPSAAQAYCDGVNDPRSIIFGYQDVLRGEEQPRWWTTCDNLSDYFGWLRAGTSVTAPNGCLNIQFFDPAQYTQGTSCDRAGYYFAFWDVQGNEDARFRACFTTGVGAGSCTGTTRTFGF